MRNKFSEEIKPLPCPFCGGMPEALIIKGFVSQGVVFCNNNNCPAQPEVNDGSSHVFEDDDEYKRLATLRWNTRTTP